MTKWPNNNPLHNRSGQLIWGISVHGSEWILDKISKIANYAKQVFWLRFSHLTSLNFIIKIVSGGSLKIQLKNWPRGISLTRKSVRDFSEQKDFMDLLLDFSWRKIVFCQRCTRFFGNDVPPRNWQTKQIFWQRFSHFNSLNFSIKFLMTVLQKSSKGIDGLTMSLYWDFVTSIHSIFPRRFSRQKVKFWSLRSVFIQFNIIYINKKFKIKPSNVFISIIFNRIKSCLITNNWNFTCSNTHLKLYSS